MRLERHQQRELRRFETGSVKPAVIKLRDRARDLARGGARARKLHQRRRLPVGRPCPTHHGWISRRSGPRGESAVYSKLARLAFESGNVSVSALASSTLLAFRMKTTPRPSLREYHCWILPSKYSLTVARTSSGITFMICARSTSAFTVSVVRTWVVGAAAGGWAKAGADRQTRAAHRRIGWRICGTPSGEGSICNYPHAFKRRNGVGHGAPVRPARATHRTFAIESRI